MFITSDLELNVTSLTQLPLTREASFLLASKAAISASSPASPVGLRLLELFKHATVISSASPSRISAQSPPKVPRSATLGHYGCIRHAA